MAPSAHAESHLVHRIGWLRAAVLGANDGILSVASVIVGVAAASTGRGDILLAGGAALAAGAMSMAAGEYVSVSSQSDTEAADLAREKRELEVNPQAELDELAAIYVERGLDPDLAMKVAVQFTAKDALAAHARDELGLTETGEARPVEAAITSALTFSVGAAAPVIAALLAPEQMIIPTVSVATIFFLIILGALGARTGGAPLWKGALRVTFWGILAMAVTAGIGHLVGRAV
ncbi:MAG: VIT family protein [Bosea sp.]|nr:VIT family protein [Bosea sp. (in: a-proteobacteria)]